MVFRVLIVICYWSFFSSPGPVSAFATKPFGTRLHTGAQTVQRHEHGGFCDRRTKTSRPGSVAVSSSVSSSATTDFAVVTSENLALLSERGRKAIENLVQHDRKVDSDVSPAQMHVYGNWPQAGIEDEGKRRLAEQVRKWMICVAQGTCRSFTPSHFLLLLHPFVANSALPLFMYIMSVVIYFYHLSVGRLR
jgi:hypothetical protein